MASLDASEVFLLHVRDSIMASTNYFYLWRGRNSSLINYHRALSIVYAVRDEDFAGQGELVNVTDGFGVPVVDVTVIPRPEHAFWTELLKNYFDASSIKSKLTYGNLWKHYQNLLINTQSTLMPFSSQSAALKCSLFRFSYQQSLFTCSFEHPNTSILVASENDTKLYHSKLDSTGVLILRCDWEIHLWFGRRSSQQDRISARKWMDQVGWM